MPKMSSKPTTFRSFILIETSFSPYFGRCLCLVPPQQSCVILRRHEKFSTSCSGLRKICRPMDPSVEPPSGKAQSSPHPAANTAAHGAAAGAGKNRDMRLSPRFASQSISRTPARRGGQRGRSEAGADAAQRSQESARAQKNATACVKGGLCGRKIQLEGVCELSPELGVIRKYVHWRWGKNQTNQISLRGKFQ